MSFISGIMKQKRMYLLSRKGNVEQSRIIIFCRIIWSNSIPDDRVLSRRRTSMKFPLGGYALNLPSAIIISEIRLRSREIRARVRVM